MGRLSNISSTQALKVFEKLGWFFDHQTGSHIIYKRSGFGKHLCIPRRRECPEGTLRSIIRDAEITVDEFLALL